MTWTDIYRLTEIWGFFLSEFDVYGLGFYSFLQRKKRKLNGYDDWLQIIIHYSPFLCTDSKIWKLICIDL